MTELLNNISNNINNSEYTQAPFWVSSGKSDISEMLWFVTFSLVLVFLGLAIFLITKFFVAKNPPKRRFLMPFSWGFVTTGFSGIIFALFRKEGVRFFSAYAFWALIILSFLIFVIFFTFRYFKYLPREQASYDSFQIKKKYLPKRKKKS